MKPAVLSRRQLLATGAAALALTSVPRLHGQLSIKSRMRVILDNDFGGDPDGLFQAAHLLACDSVELPLVIGSHLHHDEPFDPSLRQAEHAVEKFQQLQALVRSRHHPQVMAGRATALSDTKAAPSPAATAIVREAMRDDTSLPLYYAAGAGLTDLASALLLEPRIAKRLILAWIGGMEYPDLQPGVPVRTDPEYNTTIDVRAAQVVFGCADLEIWQVPRNTYRTMLISDAELQAGMDRCGALGTFLMQQLGRVIRAVPQIGETYILGDSPLVTLTALQSSFEPDSSSSSYVYRPRARFQDNGTYAPTAATGRTRVYLSIDARLTFADMFAKLSRSAQLAPDR